MNPMKSRANLLERRQLEIFALTSSQMRTFHLTNEDLAAIISDAGVLNSYPGIVDRTIPVAIIHSDKALVAELVYAVG